MGFSFTCSKLSPQTKLAATITLFFFFAISIPKSCSATLLKPHSNTNNNNFIKISCSETLYPKLCYKKLIAYASTIQNNPMEMVNAALNLSLEAAQLTSKMVLKLSKGPGLSPRDAGAIMDCVETMGDSVDELKQSLVAMEDLDGPDFDMKKSNIETWVSAALTNEDTCMDSIEGKGKLDRNVKGIIRGRIVNVAQLTSISLALINKLLFA